MMTRYSLLFVITAASLLGNQRLAAEGRVDYLTQIKPLLESKCYSCHGVLKQEGELRLETLSLMTKGGDSGPAVVAKDAAESLLLERVSADEGSRMPPAEDGVALNPEEITLLRKWITQGAAAPVEEIPRAPSEHWAFLKIAKPVVPSSTEFTNPIDILLAAKRSEQGLQVQSPAERSILIRRLYLDLIGLPPSLDQLHDERPWEEIVDELLTNPHHGERWGRHWMDIWRYSEWYGLGAQLRNSQKHMWHWRDWIVNSLNSDKGYDRMIQEMIAGDELAPDDPDVIAGTGFLARNYYLFNRTTWLDSTIEHTGKAFLGLTLNCAKCHDHKYDPITQEDYYSFRAIFEPHQVRLDPVPGVIDFEKDGLPRVFDDHPDAETFLHVRGNPSDPDRETKIAPRVPTILASFQPAIIPVALPPTAYAPGIRDYVLQDHLTAAEAGVQAAKKQLVDAKNSAASASEDAATAVKIAEARIHAQQLRQKSLQAVIAADLAKFGKSQSSAVPQLAKTAATLQTEFMLAAADHELLAANGDTKKAAAAKDKAKAARRKLADIEKGNSDYSGIRASRKALEGPVHKESDYAPAYTRISTGRRLSLARWMTDRDNPLTARVAVNHVWTRHFGEPLIESVFDLGLRANKPLHADVLDYLAAEFMESDWSFRQLHRLIVTSQAYQLSSSATDPQTIGRDPANQFYWRMNVRRMESQIVRDSILQLAGSLDPALGGPSQDVGNDSRRRSLYFKHSRDQHDTFLTMFDDADLLQCYRRSESIVPQQALALANSTLSMTMAQKIAKAVADSLQSADQGSFVDIAFGTLLCREPTPEEQVECLTFCEELRTLLRTDIPVADINMRIQTRLIHSLLNHNDFISIR